MPHTAALCHLLTANKVIDARQYGADGGPLHDPTTDAYLLKPTFFSGRKGLRRDRLRCVDAWNDNRGL